MATSVIAGVLTSILRLDKSGYSRGLKQADGEATKFSKSSSATFTAWGTALKVTLAAVGAAFTKTIIEGAKLEKQLASVATMVTGNLQPTMAMFRSGLIDMTREYGETTETLSKGLYDILSAGIDTSKALNVLEVAAISAKAGMTETGVTADALTTLINAYGASAEEAGGFSDLLFTIVKRGKTTMDELAPSIGRVGTLAAQAGVDMDEVGAALAVMTRRGLSTDEAVTALRATLTQLLKPSDEAMQTAKALGIEFGSQALAAKGLSGVLESIKGLPPDVVTKLFPNVRALTGVLAATDEMGSEMAEFQRILEAGSPTLEAYAKSTDTISHSFDQMKRNMAINSAIIGESFAPALKELFDLVNGWLSGGAEGFESFWANVGEAALKAAQGIVTFANNSGPIFQWLGRVFAPIGNIVREFWQLFQDAFNDIVGILFGTKEDADAAFQGIQFALKGAAVAITTWFRISRFALKTYIEWVKATVVAMKEAGSVIVNIFRGNWEAARESAKNVGDAFRTMGQNIKEDFVGTLGDIRSDVENAFSVQNMNIDELRQVFRGAADEADGLKESTVELFRATGEAAGQAKVRVAEMTSEEIQARIDVLKEQQDREDELREEQVNKRRDSHREVVRQIEEEREAYRNQMQSRYDTYLEFRDLQKTELELEIEDINLRKEQYIQAGVDRVEAERWAAEEIAKANEESAQKTERAWRQRQQAVQSMLRTTFGFFQNTASAYFDLERSNVDASVEDQRKAEREKARIARQQFHFNKAMSLINIAIATREAFMAAMKMGPIIGQILGAMVFALGGAQATFVAAQKPPPMPKYQQGGVVQGPPGTDQVVARLTAGEFVMPPTQTAANINELERMRSGETRVNVSAAPVVLELDGRAVGKGMIEFLQDESDRGGLRINKRAVRDM